MTITNEKNPLSVPAKTTTKAPKPYTVKPTKNVVDRGPPTEKADKPDDTSTRTKDELKSDKNQAAAVDAQKAGAKTASKSSSTKEVLGGGKVSTDEVLGKVTNAETQIGYHPELLKQSFKDERARLKEQLKASEITQENHDAAMALLDLREENNTPPYVRNRVKA